MPGWRDKRQPRTKVKVDIAAENTFSDWIFIRGGFNFSLSGTWSATVHIQRSFDEGITPLDVEAFTANIEKIGEEPEGAWYRFGVKSGNYTSGPVTGRISQ